jgi:hypothetical protein
MDEAFDHDLFIARLRNLIGKTAVTMLELAVLLSAFESLAHSGELLREGGVPPEELSGVPDPDELLAKEQDMTTGEGVEILRRFLDMSEEGEARLWRLLHLDEHLG